MSADLAERNLPPSQSSFSNAFAVQEQVSAVILFHVNRREIRR